MRCRLFYYSKKEVIYCMLYKPQNVYPHNTVIDADDVVQNMSPTVHETIHALPKVTSSEVDYISGGITCGLGQIECSDKTFIDDIYKVEAWRKFIVQKCVYLLKSPKGDVWVVNISSNPTSKYERNTKSLTTISFNFVETKALDEISIVT